MTVEHRVEMIHDGESNEGDLLTKMGGDGWQLCSVRPVSYFRQGYTDVYYYFVRNFLQMKKQKPTQQPEPPAANGSGGKDG